MNRLRFITVVLVAVAIGALAIAIRHATEPVYLGRTLTVWLREGLNAHLQFNEYRWTAIRHSETNATFRATATAIKNIGPAAIPLLLDWSQADDFPVRTKVIKWLNTHGPFHFHVESAGDRHAMAHLGFVLLGDQAKSAWPALIRLTKARYSEHRYWAFYCLLACQPDRQTLLPVLTRLIHDPDTIIQFFAAHVFHEKYPEEAESAGVYQLLPFLKENSTNSPSQTRSASTR